MRADDSAFSSGRGCYTTGRFAGGRVRFGERVVRRLARDARTLDLGEVDEALCLAGMVALGKAHFGDGEGVVRLQASRDGAGSLHLVGVARAVGPEPSEWRAISPPFPHHGPAPYSGAKVTNHLLFAMAREQAVARRRRRGRALRRCGLPDRRRARQSSCWRWATGAWRLRACGGAESREWRGGSCWEKLPEIAEAELHRRTLGEAQELIAVNAVRGARPVIELDGKPVGDGRPGPAARSCARLSRPAE